MSNNNIKEISGFNIYTDKKGRTVYYDRLSKNGYIIPPNKYDSYTNYSIRLIVAIFVAYLSALFLEYNYWAGALVGIATYVAYTFVFHKRFLSQMSVIPDFKPPFRENYIDRNVKSMPKKRAYTIIIIAAFLIAAVAVNAIVNGYDSFMFIMNIALILFAIGFIVVHIIIIVRKKQTGMDF